MFKKVLVSPKPAEISGISMDLKVGTRNNLERGFLNSEFNFSLIIYNGSI